MKNRTNLLQWHPAFFAGIQVDLEENLWLRVLSNKLDDPEIINRMLQEYEQHRDYPLYSSIVEIVVQANQLLFRKEGSTMSG